MSDQQVTVHMVPRFRISGVDDIAPTSCVCCTQSKLKGGKLVVKKKTLGRKKMFISYVELPIVQYP